MYKKSPSHSSHFVIILQLTIAVPSAIAIGRLAVRIAIGITGPIVT